MRSVLPAVLLAFASCAGAPARPSPSDVRAELRAADVALNQATQSHDKATFSTLVCSDAAFGEGTFAQGRDAILARWAPYIEGRIAMTWAPEQAGTSSAGDLGWTTGGFHYAEPGGVTGDGRYATVWRREGGRFCAAMDTDLKAPGETPIAHGELVSMARSAAGDLIAETGWLAGKAGTWLEVRRCEPGRKCVTEVLSVVPAPPAKKEP